MLCSQIKIFFWLQVVGHSLGGGTAALLTYALREQKELAAATCVSFAPGEYNLHCVAVSSTISCHSLSLSIVMVFNAAACMTWELAESSNEFVTSVINGADLVPTFSAASVDDLRAEVYF